MAEHEEQLAEAQKLLDYWNAVKAEHERVKAEDAKVESEQPKAEEQQQTEEQVPTEEVPKQTEQGETSVQQGTPIDTDNQGSGQGEVKHEEAEPFNNLAAEVKKATGEKKNSILGQMRDIIANFAKKNGYAEPVFHLTREDFLNAAKPEDRAELEEDLNNGFHMPAYYEDGKLHVFVEGCENFGVDVAETLAHESTHADNAENPENVSMLTHAIENEHSVSIDEMLDILRNMSHSDRYEVEYDRLEAKGKDPNVMLADEVISHAVARMVTDGEAALDEITNNETIKAVVRRAYNFRENERQRGIRASETSERNNNEIQSSVGDSRIENETTEGRQESDGHESTDQSQADTGRTESGRVDESSQGESVSVEDFVQNHPDFKKAYEKGSDVMRVWRKKLEAYAAEHFPNEESLETMMKDPAFAKLYNDAEKADKEERAKVGEVVERLQKEYQEQHSNNTKHSLFENRTTESGEVEPLSDEQVSAITEVSDFLGQKLQVVDSAVDKQGRRNNGLYDPNTGTIIISRDTQHPMGLVFGHEATHAVKEMSGGAYDDLHSAVREMMGDEKWKAEVAHKKQLYKDNGIELTDEGAAEEVVADYVGSTLNQGENLKKLAYRLKHPVLSKIRESLTKLLDFFRGKKMTAEEKRVQGMLDTITEAMRNAKADGSQSKVGVQKHSIFDPRFEKGGKDELSHEERLNAEVMYDTLKKAIGDDSAIIDGEVGQRVLDDANKRGESVRLSARKKRALETATWQQHDVEANQATVVSSADGAKILKNLDTLADQLEENESNRSKTFLGNVAKAIGASEKGSSSQYATFETKNGRIITIRLANHNASTIRFDNAGRDNAISIVITNKNNTGIELGGNAHIVEFYYNKGKLINADGKPLADIVRSIKQALYSGEFKDTTGLAEREEVNGDDFIAQNARFFRTKDGVAYGFTVGGKVYIDPRVANSETPIHEYSHLWATAMQKGNPEEWKNIVKLMKGTRVWDEVRKTYPELENDSDIADEVLAHYSGRRGAERLREKMREIADGKGSPLDKADAMNALHKVKAALDKFWKGVADFLGIHFTTAEEVADRVMKDLLDGVDPREHLTKEDIETDSTLRFHKEKDEDTLKKLNSEPTIKVYRAMQVIDGKLYPPMAAKVGKGLVEPNELGVWIRADENPDLAIADIDKKTGKQKADKNGELKWKFKLDKGGKDALGKKATDVVAAYNPYWHTSRSPLNDQFKSAWIRPNIVIVECEVPEKELTSGYKAERAKDSVGEVDWKSGSVSGEVFKQTGNARKVILSRWCKPVRILSDAEVAQKSKEFIGDANVVIPENVLTPKQKVEFEKVGLKIGEPEKGVNKTEQIEEALKKGLMVDNSLKSDSDEGLLFRDAEEIRLSAEEYAKLDRAIHTHNNFKNGRVNGDFTDNNYYLYTHHRDGSFDIKDGFPIVGNEDIIKQFQDGIKEGTIRNAKDIARFAKELQINRDGDNSSNVDAERGSRRNGGFDSLDLSRETDGRPSNESMGEGISGLSPEEIHSGGRIENIEEEAAKIVDSIFDYDIANSVYALRGQFRDYNTKELLDHIMYNVEHRQPKGWVENNRYAVEIIRKCIEARKRELDGKPARYPKRKDFIRRGKPLFRLKVGTFIKSGSYFSGGGLLEEGLKRYLDPSVAVEFNEKISGVYADNFGNHIVTADVRDVDPRELAKHVDGEVQYFHASPVCKNYSRAKRDGGEVELDKETAQSTADFIKEKRPKVVTIENVKGYKNSEALKIITDELTRQGYDWDMDVYNAADYGGYTKRERLIIRAVRDGKLPEKPKPLPESERKHGWMEAVDDLIDDLPEKEGGVKTWMVRWKYLDFYRVW